MKTLIGICIGLALGFAFCKVIVYGMEKEARRQCIVALDHCENYGEYGACEERYLKVCDGVEI